MACEDYVDSRIDAAAGVPVSREASAHLESCVLCQGEVLVQRALLARVDEEFRDLLSASASPGLEARIYEALVESAQNERNPRRALAVWALVAASLVASASLTLWRYATNGRDARPMTPLESVVASAAPTVESTSPRAMQEALAIPLATDRASKGSTMPQPGSRLAATVSTLRPKAVDQEGRHASRSQDPASSAQIPSDEGCLHEPLFVDAEILVPPGQAEELHRFVEQLRGRRIDPDAGRLAGLPVLAWQKQTASATPALPKEESPTPTL